MYRAAGDILRQSGGMGGERAESKGTGRPPTAVQRFSHSPRRARPARNHAAHQSGQRTPPPPLRLPACLAAPAWPEGPGIARASGSLAHSRRDRPAPLMRRRPSGLAHEARQQEARLRLEVCQPPNAPTASPCANRTDKIRLLPSWPREPASPGVAGRRRHPAASSARAIRPCRKPRPACPGPQEALLRAHGPDT